MNPQSDQVAQRSEELFASGLFCAESMLQAVAESRGIKSDLIPKITTGLCSGLSRTGGICGAVSGGVLAINLVCGRTDTSQSVEDNYRFVRQFLKQSDAKFGSTNCERLIGCRLDTPAGQRFFRERKLGEKCTKFTRAAARIASEILADT
jgi:C_GCAxxG_C_C family probable redox protein